ncbi:uncharacterized protein [Asterias amurensis]|uniref:uncharacterized protein isoform X3 n=1 Tax=Asterias amurensis TaxID=7602 RepID=UPI003AB521E2
MVTSDVTSGAVGWCSLPSLSGGGNVKYQPKPRQEKTVRRTQDPLVALPQPKGRREKTLQDDSRYVTRSVPVHSARHKQNEADRGSNSAPMPDGHHRSNHDRKPGTRLPKLPKINNLLKEPMQQQVHGTSTATETGRKEKGGKRWASSWAGARATNPPTRDETRVPTSDNSSQPASNIASPVKTPSARQSNQQMQDTPKTSPSTKSSTPGTGSSSPVKPSKEPDPKSHTQHDKGSRRTEAQEQKTKSSFELNANNKPVKETTLKEGMRTTSVSKIDTKVTKRVPVRSKSSAVLTSRSDVTRQNSEASASPLNKTPKIIVKTDSRDSQSTSTTQQSRVKPGKPVKKKRIRRPVIITRKSVIKQKSLQSVYGNKTVKYQRQIRVLKKMEQVQRKEIEEFNQELKDKQNQRMASVVRQRMALKRARDRFDEEQVRRFRNQYVSWRSVEEKRLNTSSEIYGLPDFIYEDRYEKTLKKIPESEEATSSKKTPKKFQKYATWVRNLKVFESMLNPKVRGNVEGLFQAKKVKTIVEGIDTVKLDDNGGSARKKKVNVKRLIGSAKKLLAVAENNMDDISEVSSYVSSDDDDSSLDLSDDDDS